MAATSFLVVSFSSTVWMSIIGNRLKNAFENTFLSSLVWIEKSLKSYLCLWFKKNVISVKNLMAPQTFQRQICAIYFFFFFLLWLFKYCILPGVIFASTSAGFGELSFLSLTVFYSRYVQYLPGDCCYLHQTLLLVKKKTFTTKSIRVRKAGLL